MQTAHSAPIPSPSPLGRLIPVADNLWVVEHALRFYGIPLTTRMTVVRLSAGAQAGALVLISPVPLPVQVRAELAELGQVRYIIAPNLYHHLYAQECVNSYPTAEFWAVEGMDHKRPDLKPTRILTEPEGALEDLTYCRFGAFRVLEPRGNLPLNEYLFWHRPSGTVILTDSAFHFGPESHWFLQGLARLLGLYQKLQPSLLERFALRDRPSALATLQTLMRWDFDRVIVAHGSIVETHGKQRLRQGFEWYLQQSLEGELV
jgi:hypothetical protein